jgi:ABC-type amino acid transport substrate-binding protein
MYFPSHSTNSTLIEGTLQIAAFPGFAPFAWREGGLAHGRDIAFLRRFAIAHGLVPIVTFHNFERLWELPAKDLADIAASGISLRSQKTPDIQWSEPYGAVRRTLLIRADEVEVIQNISDVRRLAVVPQSFAQQHAEAFLPDSSSLHFISSLENGIEDLLLGNIDAVGTGSVSARFQAARHPGLAILDVHGALPPELISFTTRPPLVSALDAFILRHRAEY